MHLGRYGAYERTLRAARLPVRDEWVVYAPPAATLDEILGPPLHRLFGGRRAGADRPDAFFMMNDGLAVPALEVLSRLDVAVIGMGDLPLTGHAGIGLSAVREPVRELAVQAALAALALARDPATRVRRVIRHDELIVRRTTAPP
jgi:LacI family transcriptional regulator